MEEHAVDIEKIMEEIRADIAKQPPLDIPPFNTGISAADCIHIEHINFFASKQVNCIYNQNVINIGDFVRYSCDQNYYGIISKACVQTGTGSSWGEPTEYCCMYFKRENDSCR